MTDARHHKTLQPALSLPLGRASIAGAGLLACSILVSVAVVFLRSERDRTLRESGTFLIPRDIVSDPSARADILFWGTRKLLMLPLALAVGARAPRQSAT